LRAAVHAGSLRRLAERRPGKTGIVLVYHRIGADATLDAPVAEPVFLRQLRHVVDAYRIVAPRDVVDAADARSRGERFPLAITFDDDVESHARVAVPALRAHGVPATFFLTGRTLEGPAPFWWDDLERIVRRDGELPRLPGVAATSVKELAARIEALAPAERAGVSAELGRLAPPGGDRGLSADDVRALAREFEIGFHTRAHDPPATVSDTELLSFVQDGRDAVARAAGTEIASFAYPHGRADERAATAVRDAGYQRAYTGAATPVNAGSDPLLVPRYQAATTEDGLRLQLARAVAAATGGGRS